jgi:hypothetical protein
MVRTLLLSLVIAGLFGACVEPNPGRLREDATAPGEAVDPDSAAVDAPESDLATPDGDSDSAPVDAARDLAVESALCSGPASQACGRCGTQTRTCSGGQWSAWSTCTGEGVCAPSTSQSCGSGGMQSCGGDCKWGPCGNQSCPGPSSQACGNCGTSFRTCDNSTGAWSAWSACTGQGPCAPNATQACGTAGGSQTCGSDCRWGACSCVGPNTQACNCTGTSTRTCLDGSWSGWSGCVGGTNTNSDAQNCGSCGHRCASATCVGGVCACGTCGACQKCDTTTGICVANVGAACPVNHGGGACDASGNCKTTSCDLNYANCSGVCTAEGDHSCGPTCNDCYLPPNTATPHIDVANCINHACKITQCNSEGPFCAGCPKIEDWSDCNNTWSDGCEIDVTTDSNNCGDCRQTCSSCQPGSPLGYCQFCNTSPCNTCKKHPHSAGPGISCDQ